MKRALGIANAVGLVVALGLSVVSGLRPAAETAPGAASPLPLSTEAFPVRETGSGLEIRDKSGVWLELLPYRRIASGSTLADELLLEFCEPERIVSFTAYSQEDPLRAHRYAGKPHLSALDDIERLVALRPDVLLLNTLGSETRVARLRDLGIRVFDLGEMRGVSTFQDDARAVAAIVGRPELGERFAAEFVRRLTRVAGPVNDADRPRAAYLSVFGTSIYGGGRNTSYDDIIRFGGLANVLATAHDGWPALSVEELLALDPELIVTHSGMGQTLCSLSQLARLSACRAEPRRFVELPPSLLSDPGSGMLRAAEAIHDGALRLHTGDSSK